MRISASCVVLATVLFLSPAHATKVSAKITVGKEYKDALEAEESSRASGGKESYWKLPNSILPVRSPSVEFGNDAAAVLIKEGAPSSKPDEIVTVKVHAGRLEKDVVVTRPGSTLRFLNVSPYNQEMYSPDLSSFKPEMQSKDSLRTVEFPAEGVFQIKSKLYPNFSAHVIVTQGKTVALKSDGTFAEELEPGQYTLKVFHNGKWVHKQSFTVEGGRMEPLKITLKPGRGESASAESPKSEKNKPEKDAEAKKQATPDSQKSGN